MRQTWKSWKSKQISRIGNYDADQLQFPSYHDESYAAFYPLWDVLHCLDLSSEDFLTKTTTISTLTALLIVPFKQLNRPCLKLALCCSRARDLILDTHQQSQCLVNTMHNIICNAQNQAVGRLPFPRPALPLTCYSARCKPA